MRALGLEHDWLDVLGILDVVEVLKWWFEQLPVLAVAGLMYGLTGGCWCCLCLRGKFDAGGWVTE